MDGSVVTSDKGSGGSPAPSKARFAAAKYQPVNSADAAELTDLVADWNFDFAQLKRGGFSAAGGIAELDCVSVARLVMSQPLRHRGFAPSGSVAVMMPGTGSGAGLIRGRELEADEVVTLADGSCLDAITREGYVDVAIAVDQEVLRQQSHWLHESRLGTIRGTRVELPGQAWRDRVIGAVEWIFTAAERHADALARADVRASIRDQLLAVLAQFDYPDDSATAGTRDARARQRIAVERAREYINTRLSEPLRLSALCAHAHVQARTLEYGFREITGLTPIAYVKVLRLNAVRDRLVRPAESDSSISGIALDNGFWHLSQFAVDYHKFFGETPTTTRRRAHERRNGA